MRFRLRGTVKEQGLVIGCCGRDVATLSKCWITRDGVSVIHLLTDTTDRGSCPAFAACFPRCSLACEGVRYALTNQDHMKRGFSLPLFYVSACYDLLHELSLLWAPPGSSAERIN